MKKLSGQDALFVSDVDAALEVATWPVRLPPGTTHDPRFLFADVLSDAEQTAMLLDADGLVLAGAYVAYDGNDVAQEVGAELSGVTDAARRATRHLMLGEWTSIVFEENVSASLLHTCCAICRRAVRFIRVARWPSSAAAPRRLRCGR